MQDFLKKRDLLTVARRWPLLWQIFSKALAFWAQTVCLRMMEGYCCSKKLIFDSKMVAEWGLRFKWCHFSGSKYLFYLHLKSSFGITLVCGERT